FFNLGVQHSRSLAATQLYQEKLAHVVVSSASPSVAQTAQVSLPQVPQVPGVGILPAETQVGPRTMEQYISQLGIAGPQAQALLRQAQSHHLAQQAQLLAAAASVRLPDRPHPTYGSSILPLHADLLQLASQVPISVSAAVSVGQVLKPVAVGGGSQDAAFSPRPPPVDPSPPRTLADASTSIIDSNPSTLVHQQAQTSPPGSSDQPLDKRDTIEARPQSAREQSSSASAGARVTPQV
ncbi:unnamed protein product, partial [Cylicostephanus goldi]